MAQLAKSRRLDEGYFTGAELLIGHLQRLVSRLGDTKAQPQDEAFAGRERRQHELCLLLQGLADDSIA